jgi:hypothetical protein
MGRSHLAGMLRDAKARADAGHFDAARALCQQVLDHDPGMIGALQTYMAVTRVGPDDPVLARLQGVARGQETAPHLMSQVLFMLGKGLDDIGDHSGAFAAFVEANRMKNRPFNSPGQERLAAALTAAVDAMPAVSLPSVRPRMIFVLGMPRSGTSLVAQMLGAHDAIENRGEVTALGEAARTENRDLAALARGLTAEQAERIRAAYLARVAPRETTSVLVDKMPENYWLAWLVPAVMPDAVIVHMRRDPRATCWSCFRNDFGQGHDYSTDFPTLAAHYARYAGMVAAFRARNPRQWVDILLDDLVADPAGQLAPVMAALGLDWQGAMAAPGREGGTLSTLSRWQARQAPDARMANGWRVYLPLMERQWPGAVAHITP